jgi:RNA polymerase sigma-70 factor, ECF subfamily
VSREVHKARYPHLADEDLMVLVGGGDPRAFAALYDRYFRLAYSVAYKLIREKWAAEDLTQEAFLKVWRSAESYRPGRGSVKTWILSVVRNQNIDRLRIRASRRRMREKIEASAASAPRYEPSEAFAKVWHHARLGRLREALEALPYSQRQVLELAHFSGLTHTEIAERLQLPPGTVKGRIRLGLEKLRNDTKLGGVAVG